MTKRKKLIVHRRGCGLVNSLINNLPFELHLPGYSYCGPGTALEKRLQRGDKGINQLDAACKEHDIAYSQSKEIIDRHVADKVLENKAWERVKSKDANSGEKAAAWFVTTAMKGKRKLGMGMNRTLAARMKRKFRTNVKRKQKKGGALKKKTRIIRSPRKGGFLPLLLPLLGALGALGGGAAGIAKAVNDAKTNRLRLDEQKRHNQAMEGKGLRKGKGLYLRPYGSKN